MSTERVAIVGGTFDPVHCGHVALARGVHDALGADPVLLVVANDPWQKSARRTVTPAEVRYELVSAAAAGIDGVLASRMEIDRGGVSHSADTVAEVAAAYPGAEVLFVVGSDLVDELDSWVRAGEIACGALLVVVDRPGQPPRDPGAPWRVEHLVIPDLPDVSSSAVRAAAASVAAGADPAPLAEMVPDAVMQRIRTLGLYASERR